MSEYWKSTPNYWCKFCQTYVRDTKFEKQKHEATPKHQGNIQRSLRNLHKTNEREEREKQRAKDEVERLNGIVSGKSAKNSLGSLKSTGPSVAPSAPKSGDPQERKRQLAQLADLGVAIPEEYRKEMAMAGEWQAVRAKRKKEKDEEESKSDINSYGTRKRKVEDDDEDDEQNYDTKNSVPKNWGSKFKTYSEPVEDVDLDALMVKGAPGDPQPSSSNHDTEASIKKEESQENINSESELPSGEEKPLVSPVDGDEEGSHVPTPVFKKRKTKIRNVI